MAADVRADERDRQEVAHIDTIFALSSGSPPAAIAVIRISGPRADEAVKALIGRLPKPRRASLATLRWRGEVLDNALVIRFPGPASATGEDVAELHVHGGRSVVAAVLEALGSIDGLRAAQPGEFTRRALENGRIDLTEAEGLADLLTAETQSQRRTALTLAGGALGRKIDGWQRQLLALAGAIEASLDFSDESDVADELDEDWRRNLEALLVEVAGLLVAPPAERLRDGIKVVIAGPPNAGKSTLLNVLAGREAAITSAIPGTTRDVVEAPTAIGGTPFLLTDTAGLRDSADPVESMGVVRARGRIDDADLVIWLGEVAACPVPERAIFVASKSDLHRHELTGALPVSAVTGEGITELVTRLRKRAEQLLPAEGEVAINARHRAALLAFRGHLEEAASAGDLLIKAEALRAARLELDRITGRAGVEQMLDLLFAGFCIGK